jgi:hypothetical protein
MAKSLILFCAATAAVILTSPAIAEFSKQLPEGPCANSIKAIGPATEYKTGPAPDGKPAIFSIVRSDGHEYLVRCDQASGMINDVAPHLRTQQTQ